MSDLEPNDSLWKVLEHARRVEPSPFFARNVVREVRRIADAPAGSWESLRRWFAGPRTAAATAACALVAVAMVFLLQRGGLDQELSSDPGLSWNEENAESFDPASEMAAVEYLGQLMAVADPGQLDDEALADLFF